MKRGKIKKELRIQTRRGTYRVVLTWDEADGAFLVRVPSLPGVVTFGKGLSDAKRMARDAIELYCDCVTDERKIVIDDTNLAIGKIPAARIVSAARWASSQP